MIFVTVGTTPFEGLVRAADRLSTEMDVVIQKSSGEYCPKNHKFFEYTDKFKEYIKEAEVVVTHGGAGTLFQLLDLKKKIIGVANLERDDKHQTDILKELSDEGYIIWCQDITKLHQAIELAKKKKLKKYHKPKCTIAEEIIKRFGT